MMLKRSSVTLSPFFGQFRGLLKVYSRTAYRDHFNHSDAQKPVFSEFRLKMAFGLFSSIRVTWEYCP